MNTNLEKGLELPIMEHFYTIQGEGFHTGMASYFIRIGGCDVGCHWCDVKESWNPEIHPITPIDEVVQEALKHSRKIVLTGGEPLMYPLSPITDLFKENGCSIHIETSGAYPLSGKLDWICLSPKKTALPLPEIYGKANELKMIIYNQHDFKFAEEQASKVAADCELYLQPEWSKKEEMIPLIIPYILDHPKWKLSLQTHKYINIP